MVRHSNCRSYYSFFQPTGYPVGCFHLALCPAACAYDSAARCCANGCFSDLTRQPVYMVFSARRCANGSFACARFALLRGPLVIARVRATRSRLGQRGNMLIPTFARNVTENHIYRLNCTHKNGHLLSMKTQFSDTFFETYPRKLDTFFVQIPIFWTRVWLTCYNLFKQEVVQ